jgi:sugar-specific transcriptional regulator TrmB
MVLTHIKQNHSCVSVEEVAQKQREILKSSCATLDEKLSEGNKALNNISGVMKSLEENATATKEKIKKQTKNIAKAVLDKLNERAEKLYQEVDEIYGEKHTELSKQHDEIKEYIDKVQGNVSLLRHYFFSETNICHTTLIYSAFLYPDSTTAKFFARNFACEAQMIGHG